jgi:hypothetical protein
MRGGWLELKKKQKKQKKQKNESHLMAEKNYSHLMAICFEDTTKI